MFSKETFLIVFVINAKELPRAAIAMLPPSTRSRTPPFDAFGWLLKISESAEERREAFIFIYEAFVQQSIFGDGLLVVREQARGAI